MSGCCLAARARPREIARARRSWDDRRRVSALAYVQATPPGRPPAARLAASRCQNSRVAVSDRPPRAARRVGPRPLAANQAVMASRDGVAACIVFRHRRHCRHVNRRSERGRLSILPVPRRDDVERSCKERLPTGAALDFPARCFREAQHLDQSDRVDLDVVLLCQCTTDRRRSPRRPHSERNCARSPGRLRAAPRRRPRTQKAAAPKARSAG